MLRRCGTYLLPTLRLAEASASHSCLEHSQQFQSRFASSGGFISWLGDRFSRPRVIGGETNPQASDGAVASPDGTTGLAASPQDSTPQAEPNYFPLSEGDDEALSAIQQALGAEEFACLATANKNAWPNTYFFMSGIQYCHSQLDFPWWASIALVNIITKICTSPLGVMTQKAVAKTIKSGADLAEVQKLHAAFQVTTSQEEKNLLATRSRKLYKEHLKKHGDPRRNVFVAPACMIGSAVFFISLFNAVRNLTSSQAHSLTHGGALWFTDLTIPDPYLGLPLLCWVAQATSLQLNSATDASGTGMNQYGLTPRQTQYLLIGGMGLIAAVQSYAPAGTGVVWLSNSCFMIGQNMLLRQPRVRKALGLPTLEEMRKMSAEAMAARAASTPQPTVLLEPPKPTFEKGADGKPVLLMKPPPGKLRSGERRAR